MNFGPGSLATGLSDSQDMNLSETQAAELTQILLGKGSYRIRRFGAGKFSEVFAVEDGARKYVLRVAPPDDLLQLFYVYRMMRQEPAIHHRLRAEADVPVPEILAHDFSRKFIDRDFLIMPRLDGEPLSRTGLSGRQRNEAIRQWGGVRPANP